MSYNSLVWKCKGGMFSSRLLHYKATAAHSWYSAVSRLLTSAFHRKISKKDSDSVTTNSGLSSAEFCFKMLVAF